MLRLNESGLFLFPDSSYPGAAQFVPSNIAFQAIFFWWSWAQSPPQELRLLQDTEAHVGNSNKCLDPSNKCLDPSSYKAAWA